MDVYHSLKYNTGGRRKEQMIKRHTKSQLRQEVHQILQHYRPVM